MRRVTRSTLRHRVSRAGACAVASGVECDGVECAGPGNTGRAASGRSKIAAMGDLAEDTAVHGADGRFVADLSPEWEIWGPSGGYVASVAVRAAAAHAGFERPASFSCHFLSVARFEQVQIDVRTLRTSRRAESVAVSMSQDRSEERRVGTGT